MLIVNFIIILLELFIVKAILMQKKNVSQKKNAIDILNAVKFSTESVIELCKHAPLLILYACH